MILAALLEPDFEICKTLYQSTFTAVYRVKPRHPRSDIAKQYILKVCPLDSEAAVALRREYAILQKLEPPYIIQSYYLESYPAHKPQLLCLALEDRLLSNQRLEGQTLEGQQLATLRQVLEQTPLALELGLHLANSLAKALTALHAQGVIHCDINPSNILLNQVAEPSLALLPDPASVTFIDFGAAQAAAAPASPQQASPLPAPHDVRIGIGTLAYLAPEQSGHSRRAVDARSDLYALGVTLYELFSKQLPFRDSDPAALVHAHLTRTPEVPADVPMVLSRIVLKLLEKDPDARYPTAAALLADLQICLEHKHTLDSLAAMPLAGQALELPRWLPGRKQIFEQLRSARAGVHILTGAVGSGKRYLLSALEQTARGACVLCPLSAGMSAEAFAAAFAQPLQAMLHADDASLQAYRSRLQQALGDSATCLAQQLPVLAQVLALPLATTATPAAPWQDAWLKLLQVLAEDGLLVLVDNLQLATPEVWHMLEQLSSLATTAAVTLVVTAPSLEAEQLAAFARQGQQYALPNLDLEALETLCQQLAIEAAPTVATWLWRKTAGNPAALTSLFQHCLDESILSPAASKTAKDASAAWLCDVKRLAAQPLAANVAQMRLATLAQRSQAEQALLCVLACWGDTFHAGDIDNAGVLAAMPALEPEIGISANWADLWQKLLAADYLRLVSDAPQTAMFAHAALQQAAYACCETYAEKFLTAFQASPTQTFASRLHYAIGRYWLAREVDMAGAWLEHPLSHRVAHHLARGMLWLDASEQHALSRGLLALADSLDNDANTMHDADSESVDSKVALQANYLHDALRALTAAYGEAAWLEDYPVTLRLHQRAAELACRLRKDSWLADITEAVLRQRRTALDAVDIYAQNIQRHMALGQHEAVIAWVQRAMADFGKPFEREPSPLAVRKALLSLKARLLEADPSTAGQASKPSSDSFLLNLPAMQNPQALAENRLLALMSGSAFALSSQLYALSAIMRMHLLLEHGHSEFSPAIFAAYGLLLAGQDEHLAHSYYMGQLAERLLAGSGHDAHQARTLLVVNVFLRHWREPLHNVLAGLVAASEAGRLAADNNFTVRPLVARVRMALSAGYDLMSLENELRQYCQEASDLGQDNSALNLAMIYQMVRVLRDPQAADPAALGKDICGTHYDEKRMLSEHIAVDSSAAYVFYCLKVQLLVCFGHYHEARQWLEPARDSLIGRESTSFAPMFVFYEALVLLASYHEVSAAEQAQYLRIARSACKRLATWAQYAAANYQHRLRWLEAEISRLQGDDARAREQFDVAIEAAKQSRFQHEYALFQERAAAYYQARGLDRYARVLWQDALASYQAWGAEAKVAQLRFLQPVLQPAWLPSSSGLNPYATTGSSIALPNAALLDVSALMQASQTLAQSLELADVLRDILRLSAQTAAAQKAVLVLLEDAAPIVEGWFTAESCQVRLAIPLTEAPDLLPASVVRYVLRSAEAVLLSDAAHQGRFRDDPYIVREQVSSLLGMPVIYKNFLRGVLYLEHRSLRAAFDEGRLQVLELLLGQAAISLENARLYGKQEALLQQLSQTLADLQTTQGQLAQFEAEQAAVRYIQRVLLPSEDELRAPWSLELAGLSESAEDVGGDYFDVLPMRLDDQAIALKIIIGDVTGHGLQSGMLMLMAQTAVRTLISDQQIRAENSPENLPEKSAESLSAKHFLEVLNRSLHANLQRSRIDKSMTLLALDYYFDPYVDPAAQNQAQPCARVRLSGQHEHVIVLRHTRQVELIDTLDLGFPLGLVDDIGDFVAEQWLNLAPGDGIVLYTDGISEAENAAGEQYGMERLVAVLQAHWYAPASAIVDAVQADVHAHIGEHEVFDDITLLLLKQR